MNDNNTIPAMKEVETVEHAAERLNEYAGFNMRIAWKSGFKSGAQWREENPVKPVAKEGKTALVMLDEAIEANGRKPLNSMQTIAVMQAYAAQLTEVKGEEKYSTANVTFIIKQVVKDCCIAFGQPDVYMPIQPEMYLTAPLYSFE
jgi:hypothetical protein